jgi:hypothetical protein
LGYIAGLLSVHVGIPRTIKGIDVINGVVLGPDADRTEYFTNLICLLAVELREMDWDRSVNVLEKVMAKP